jgi:gluconokinase
MVIVILGVSGAGKTTVGRVLATTLEFEFYEGDDYHSPSNRAKMHAGVPLTDADRAPWLSAIRALIERVLAREGNAVVACSALKRSYRDTLRLPGVLFVYLKVSTEVLRERLKHRAGHFFAPELLDSQLETLEEPRRALVVDANRPVSAVVKDIIDWIQPRIDTVTESPPRRES